MNIKQQVANIFTWLKALETTNFAQNDGMLGNEERGFCCLGLACHTLNIPYTDTNGYSVELPDFVGLSTKAGDFSISVKGKHGPLKNLANLNDSGEYTFKDIAKIIRSNRKGLFTEEVAEEFGKQLKSKQAGLI